MYGSGFTTGYNGFSSTPTPTLSTGSMVWTIVSFILALVGCFVVYFVFVAKKENPKQKFLAWMKSFLSFDKMLIETILKVAYIFVALFITLSSFGLISTSFVAFLLMLVLGNLFARIIFEAGLMKVMIWKNTTEIKNKLK